MLAFLFIQTILLVVILFLLYLLSWFWPPDSPWAPWWATNKTTARVMCKLVKMKKSDFVYDLGSGEGNVLVVAAKEFGAEGVGVEIDPWRVWYATWNARLNRVSQQVVFLRKNLFDADVSDASVVFVYLIPKTLKKLESKFLSELKPGSRIVTYRYPIPYLPMIAEDKERKIFVHEIPRGAKSKVRKAKRN